MTYAIGQPVRLTKSLSVQAKSGVALPPGASGTVVDIEDKVKSSSGSHAWPSGKGP